VLLFGFYLLKEQVEQGGLRMTWKKAFLTMDQAQTRDKNFYLDFLGEVFGTGKPLAKLLDTGSGYYLYDTGTNKILACRREVYDLLAGLFQEDVKQASGNFISRYGEREFLVSSEEIVEAMNTEKILLLKKATNFGLSDHLQDFRQVLNTSMQGMHMELTEKCFMNCGYCVYQDHYKEKRNYSDKSMSLETAKKAIEFLKNHSTDSDTVMIGFYGGEPLQRFSFIKDCVEYAKKIIKDKEIKFNMTTNAVSVTPEIAEYLINEGFSLLVSLDGPKEIHDRYRKDVTGKGSFDRAINGLKLLSEKYREKKKGMISINAVYTPPYSEEKINRINDFFKQLTWLPPVNVFINYHNQNSLTVEMFTQEDLKQDKSTVQWAIEKYRSDFEVSDSMVKGQIEKTFAKFIQRSILNQPFDRFYFNGCCLPGQRKTHINTDGSIHICERISSNSPSIGNVYSGFDFDAIEKVYIKEYA